MISAMEFLLTAICAVLFGGFAAQPMFRVALFRRMAVQDYMCLTLMAGSLGGILGIIYAQAFAIPVIHYAFADMYFV